MSIGDLFELIVELLILSCIWIVILVWVVKWIKRLNKWRNSKGIEADSQSQEKSDSQLQENSDIYMQENSNSEYYSHERHEVEYNSIIRLDQNSNKANEFSLNSTNKESHFDSVDEIHPFEESKDDRSHYSLDIEMGVRFSCLF